MPAGNKLAHIPGMDNNDKLVPDKYAADMASAAALSAIMLIELRNTVTEIEERIATGTACRTDLIQTEKAAKDRSEQQTRQLK